MKPPEACIFDLDGVIVHTSQFHYQSWTILADSLSIPFNKKDNEMLKGVSREDSLKKILALDNRWLNNKEFNRLLDKKNEHYLQLVSELQPGDVLEGVYSFMKALRSQNIKMAVGSSSKNAQRIIDKLELNEMFQAVIDGTKVEKTKPHPEVFLRGAKALNVQPAKCVVFEDAGSGIDAAKAAGMTAIGVGSSEMLNHAEYIINSFEGLTPKKLWSKL